MLDKHQILLVDDDVGLCNVLAEDLENDGRFAVTSAHTIAEAEERQAAQGAGFDAFLLDVDLPDGDGRAFCASLRDRGVGMPILMLAGSDVEADVVRGLSAGADDYVIKPFRTAVLMARLRSQLRGFESSRHLTINVGPYIFRPADRTMTDPGRRKRIRLTDKETRILRYLCRTPSKGVSHQALLEEVWGCNYEGSSHTLETHVYRLRQKLEVDPRTPCLIRSNGGYYSVHPASGLAAA